MSIEPSTDPGASIYSEILDKYTVVTSAHFTENELGVAAFSSHALLSPQPRHEWHRRRSSEWLTIFGEPEGKMAHFRDTPTGILSHADYLIMEGRPILHEGFLVDPLDEGAEQLARLGDATRLPVISSNPAGWLSWGSKPYFRRIVTEVLGAGSIPEGMDVVLNSATDLVQAVSLVGAGSSGALVVKSRGIGGVGNRVISPTCSHGWLGETNRWLDLRGGYPHHIVLERWIPWRLSLCLSFFVESTESFSFLAAAEQKVDTSHAKFTGSLSSVTLTDDDMLGTLEWIDPVVRRCAREGIRGVVGFDLIVTSRSLSPGVDGHELPSGDRALLVECNPRFNRHNRVGVFIERLSRLMGVEGQTLLWELTDHPVSGLAYSCGCGRPFRNGDRCLERAGGLVGHFRLLDRGPRQMCVEVWPLPGSVERLVQELSIS